MVLLHCEIIGDFSATKKNLKGFKFIPTAFVSRVLVNQECSRRYRCFRKSLMCFCESSGTLGFFPCGLGIHPRQIYYRYFWLNTPDISKFLIRIHPS